MKSRRKPHVSSATAAERDVSYAPGLRGEPQEYVTLARILRPRGRIGEVAAEILTDFPERLMRLKEALLSDGKSAPRKVSVRKCWLSPSRGGQAIFHFDGVNSINDAESLRGLEIQVPLSERVRLSHGSHYISDLIGCEVWEASPSTVSPLGVVRNVQGAGTALLVVETPRGELLIPFAQEICTRIDVAARRIDVVLPEGLRDLNL